MAACRPPGLEPTPRLNPSFNVTATATDPALGPVHFRDCKRWLWVSSVIYPLIPFAAIAGQWVSGNALWLVLPLGHKHTRLPATE